MYILDLFRNKVIVRAVNDPSVLTITPLPFSHLRHFAKPAPKLNTVS